LITLRRLLELVVAGSTTAGPDHGELRLHLQSDQLVVQELEVRWMIGPTSTLRRSCSCRRAKVSRFRTMPRALRFVLDHAHRLDQAGRRLVRLAEKIGSQHRRERIVQLVRDAAISWPMAESFSTG